MRVLIKWNRCACNYKLSCIMKRVGWRCDLFNNLVFKLESKKIVNLLVKVTCIYR